MDKALKRIVDIATESLKQEDETIQRFIAANNQAYSGQCGGILRINNERYYQFIVARGLIKAYPKPIALEKSHYDLVVLNPSDPGYDTVVEMKRWMSATGDPEIPGIRIDIENNLASAQANKALMLIYSAHPKEAATVEENLDYLCKKLGISSVSQWYWQSFDTIATTEKEALFWVAGYQVACNPAN